MFLQDAAVRLMTDELEAMRLEINAKDESITELHEKLQAEQAASAAYKVKMIGYLLMTNLRPLCL